MMRKSKKRASKAGLPPGTPVHVGETRVTATRITLFDFTAESLEERIIENVDDLVAYREKPTTTWVHVDGVSDIATVERIGRSFGLHPLTIEDLVNTHQRPKVEAFDEYLRELDVMAEPPKPKPSTIKIISEREMPHVEAIPPNFHPCFNALLHYKGRTFMTCKIIAKRGGNPE